MSRSFLTFILLIPTICLVKSQNITSGSSLNLGQKPPGAVAQIFAPGIISLPDRYEYGSVFSRNGEEFYYAAIVNQKPQILLNKLEAGRWSKAITILASTKYEHNDPFLSPDGTKLYFISDRPTDGQENTKDFDIWYLERKEDRWSAPINAGPEINTNKNEYYMSFTNDGTMYFSSNSEKDQTDDKNYDIRYSKSVGGKFTASRKLGDAINTRHYEADVFVAPDETYLIFCAEKPDGLGKVISLLVSRTKTETGKSQRIWVKR